MMITIHGLPPKSKYQDVKVLIKQECKIGDFILDNLVAEPNGCKKVRVGLADEDEGYRLMKCLDRYRCSGNFVLSVVPFGKPAAQKPPMQNTYNQRGGMQPQARNDYPPTDNFVNPEPPGPSRSMDMPSRSQWGGNNQNNQWSSSMSSQVPQNTFGFQQNQTPMRQNQPFQQQHSSQQVRPDIRGPQGRGPQEQNFRFPNKSNLPDLRAGHPDSRAHLIRSVEALETVQPNTSAQGRYPPNNQQYQAQEKPITIMKDNFQGPSSYMAGSSQQQGHFQGHGQGHGINQGPGPNQGYGPTQSHAPIQPWAQPQAQLPKQPFPKPTQMQYEKQYHEERKYPPTDNRSEIKSNDQGRMPHDNYKKYDKGGRAFSPQRMESMRRHSPSARPIMSSDGRNSPSGRRVSPSGRGISTSGRHVSPSGRGISTSGRHVSPSGRRVSPSGRGVSASGRRISPSGRGISASGRHVSPSGRRPSPSGRGISPPGRRISPNDRRTTGRGSPARRLLSPTRRDPQRPNLNIRYSPPHHLDKPSDKYGAESQKPKQVRPAYEPIVQAPNQSMYSGGYRPNIHENAQYPAPGPRSAERSPWQQDRDKAMYSSGKKMDEERRDGRARGDRGEQAASPRASRSPLRRERSPPRDRYKRHSPSPRSPRSPRRSWALEKRRSPEADEAPPPPVWPARARDDDYPPHPEGKKHVVPPWERPDFDKHDESHPAEYRGDYRRPPAADREPYPAAPAAPARDFRDPPRPGDEHRRPEPARREEPPRDPARKDFRKDIDRDFDNIYRKALEFKKRAEELRKSGERKREGYPEEERGRRDEEYYDRRREVEYDRREYRGERGERGRPGDGPERSRPPADRNYRDYAHQPNRQADSTAVNIKRGKAIEELTQKIMEKHLDRNLPSEYKLRIEEQLKLALSQILFDMFGDSDVSFIEIVIKYRAKYDETEELKILRDVMSGMPSHYRKCLKRPAPESSAIPSKTSRWSPDPNINNNGPRPSVYFANPKLRKEYEDIKSNMMSLKPKPQRLKQRVIVQSDHEHKARSSKEHYKLKSRPKYETKVKSRMRSGETIEPERLRQLKSPEKKHVDKVEAKSDYKVRPVHNTETKLNQEIIPKLKIEHKVQPELNIKPVPKYGKERPAGIYVEQKERLENKPKPEIIKRDVISQNEQKGQPNLKDKEDIKHEQKVEAEVKAVSPLTIMDDGGIPIEDIVEEQLPVEKPSGEKHELDPMMTRYIDDELQDIMLKIWEELPENPLSDNEKVVVNKLRNFAGDDIRNVFGLNLTKRLLNVYNPLFVKIQFSGKPDRVNLAVFLRKYNFIAFKRIGKADIFAAQMKTIKDFDRICIAKDIMCGEVKVTVNPCYRFTKCPPNLKTTFDDIDEDDDQEETTESNEIPKPTDTDAKDTASKSESCPTKSQENNAESNINKTTPNAAKPEVNVKTKQDTIPVKTNVDTAEPKNIAGAKPSPAKSGTNESTNGSKPNPAKSEANVAKPGPAKSGTNEITNGSKPNCEKSGPNVAKPSPAKSNINVTKPGTSTTAVKVTTAKNNAKTSMNETKAVNTIKKSHEIVNRVSNFKSKESKVTDSNNKNKRKAQRVDKNISDNDELDDNEIFALLSEGIVLDECSGSEDD